MLGLGSIQYPLISSIGGAIWLIGRVAYFHGYASGQPEKRSYGGFAYIGFFTMFGCALKTIYDLVRA